MSKILFIGSFLSKTRGTKGITESISEFLAEDGVKFKLVSHYENRIIRILDIIFALLFHKGEVVHIDVFSGNAFKIAEIASRLASFRNKRILLTLHGGKLVEFAPYHMAKVKSLFQRAKYIQTPSNFLKEYFVKQGFNIFYVPNPIKLENFPFARNEVKPNSLLWVRAFSTIYNPEVPIKILAALKAKFPEATLTMVGPDRGQLKECKNLAIELGLQSSISFVGSIHNKELYKFYQSHEVYLNTTSYESFGVSVIEAASCGIPIVSNKVGEIPYLWKDRVDILLVNNNSIEEYLECLENVFMSNEFAYKIGKNARERAEKFDWNEIKKKWLLVLK